MRAGLVLIPAYNEAPRIGEVLEAARRHAPDFDRLVVDDASRDDTAAVARRAGACVVRHPFNMGYGAALQTGYRWALRHGYPVVVQLDADGQHDPAAVPELASPVLSGELDLVLGSRFHAGSRYRMQPLRRLGSRWFSALVRWITGVEVSDPTSGLQALSPAVLRLYTSDAFPADYPDADMTVLLHRNGFRFGERPVHMLERPDVPSMHGGLGAIYYVYKMTLAIFMNAIRPRIEREPEEQ
jgi:glycosyltransferase involved in cell wall biosynthesis